jgi:cyclopropane-fatty-acyl-phospholipid synthase
VRVLASSRLRSVESAPVLDLDSLRRGPIAPAPDEANEQHYEVPPEFFGLVLGPWRKYSCGYWPAGIETLAASEVEMLRATADMAQVADGQRILDLGCGWGAFSLYAAGRFPDACLTDRIVSVEMFEHMSNYEALLERVSRWLAPGGKLFIHVFCHHEHAYRFSTAGAGDWMGREFFTGGLMPSFDLLPRLVEEGRAGLRLEGERFFAGTHYQRTAEAWLRQLVLHRDAVRGVFAETYGADQADRWIERWRLFFLACAETFGYRAGQEWGVGHYRFVKPPETG